MSNHVSSIAAVITSVLCLASGGFAGHHYTKMQYDSELAERNAAHAERVSAAAENKVEVAVESLVPEENGAPDISEVKKAVVELAQGNITLSSVYTVAYAFSCVAEKASEITKAEPEIVITEEQVRTSIEPAAELVTQNYRYTSADRYSKYVDVEGWKVPFTTDEAVFTYEGVIKSGIDFSKIDINVDSDKEIITVALPEPYIISHEIDENSFQVYDVKNSVFTETYFDEYTSMIADLKQKREDAYNSEPENKENVIRNARTIIEGLLSAEGLLEKYSLAFV